MAKRHKGLSWDKLEKLLRHAVQLASLIDELLRRVL
jgi:hypothetical protein